MNPRVVVIAGASGFIGTYFHRRFEEMGTEVRTIGRGTAVTWGDTEGIARLLDGADVLINLAGRTVNCRYNKANADTIFSSRTETTAELGRALALCAESNGRPSSLWINSSTGTIYRHAQDRPQTEVDGELGSGFSVAVAKAWEAAQSQSAVDGVRQVALRIAIVLGPDGGVMRPFVTLARLGLGGPMGLGSQMFSWIHVEDLFRSVLHIYGDTSLHGPVNAAAPEAVTNEALMRSVREALGVRVGAPSPRWLLECGAVVIRTETELVLKSRWVEPRKLVDSGFTFQHGTLKAALSDIMGRKT